MADYFFHYFLFLFLFITGRLGVEGSNDGCKITKCGENGPPIRFPFQLRPNQPKHCGYPGFELSCNHMKQTVLELPVALEVVVDKIDYISQSIYVHDPHNCFPAQAPRLNLSASPFNFLRLPVQIALFNCSPAERNIPTLVPCLSGPGYQIYAAESLGSLTEELTNCVKIRDFSFSTFGFSKHPQRDLQLSWRKPSCRLCESKDKMCRWKNYNTTTAAAAAAGEPELLECVQMPKKPTDASKIFHLAVAARKPLFIELIYDRLCRGEEMGIKIEEEEDAKIAKKLTIVGLSCIQWSPLDRPPMKTVVQMLEGKGDILAMPLNPFASIGRHESSNKPARAFNIELEVISEFTYGVQSVCLMPHQKPKSCIFEHIYFALPNLVVFDRLVYESRHLFGEILTTESPTDCNVVIAVLDFGVVAALGYAAKARMASTTNTKNRRNTP
ncbi:hypothetical protein LguiA_029815 [Lonicera macranthoides]